MAKLRVGMVGCGDVAQHTYLPDLTRMDRAGLIEFVAVSDALADRVNKAQKEYGIPKAYTDYGRMLAEAEIDLVVNLTPTQFHTQAILAAVAAHKHVYTEKPIAMSVAEAGQIIEAARREKVVVGSAPAVMTHPDLQEVHGMLRSGLIGKVCFAARPRLTPGTGPLDGLPHRSVVVLSARGWAGDRPRHLPDPGADGPVGSSQAGHRVRRNGDSGAGQPQPAWRRASATLQRWKTTSTFCWTSVTRALPISMPPSAYFRPRDRAWRSTARPG